MSIFAGVYRRHGRIDPGHPVCGELRRLISRNPQDEILVYSDARTFFVQMDLNALQAPSSHCRGLESVTLIAGEALLSDGSNSDGAGKRADLELIDDSLSQNDKSCLRRANGTFCLVSYQAESNTIRLATDKVGVRPVYYWMNDEWLIFSTALRVLEDLSAIAKCMDLRAVVETVGLGYPLADRTPYLDIFSLGGGEVLEVTGQEASRYTYWQWDQVRTTAESESVILQELKSRFDSAVARRLKDDRTSFAYLSGGLDSRCTVASLRSLEAEVHAFNFARKGTQDQVFGRLFAEAAGVFYTERPKMLGDLTPDYSMMMSQVLEDYDTTAFFPERPSVVWSGEGGSVALGHVHLSEELVSLVREGRLQDAISAYLTNESVYVSPKLMRPEIFSQVKELIQQGIGEEVASQNAEDPARNFYLFLLLNDQRRKLAAHFESIDVHRLELQLPFFDSSVLELVVSTPVDLCLAHKLYVKWLEQFASPVSTVAWQSYPGHQPCALSAPGDLTYQWSTGYQAKERRARKSELSRKARRAVSSSNFPSEVLNRRNVLLAALAHWAGWNDYNHIIGPSVVIHGYWEKCDRGFVLR